MKKILPAKRIRWSGLAAMLILLPLAFLYIAGRPVSASHVATHDLLFGACLTTIDTTNGEGGAVELWDLATDSLLTQYFLRGADGYSPPVSGIAYDPADDGL